MNEIVAFNQTKADLAKYRAAEGEKTFDLKDPQGIKDLRSHVYTLRKARSAFDKIRVSTKADALAACKNVDEQAKVIREGFDEMIDARTKPLKEIEEREEAKKQAFLDEQQAKREKEEAARLADLEAKEKELEELKAKVKADEEAVAAKDAAAKAEIERIAREKQIAEDATKAAEAEAERKLQEAEDKRVADIGAYKKKAAAAADAAIAEKARLDKIEADRVANQTYRKAVQRSIYDALFEMTEDVGLIEDIIDAMEAGKIPNVTINY